MRLKATLCNTVPALSSSLSTDGGIYHEALEYASLSHASRSIALAMGLRGRVTMPRKARRLRPDLPLSIRGCIVQPAVVQIHPGPLVRERPRVRVSSWSVSPGLGYPVDETLDDNVIIWANGRIAALSSGLTRCHALRHGADDGAFRRWSLLMCTLERLEARPRLTIFVEQRYNGKQPRYSHAVTGIGGPQYLVV
ncbi:hypothetical protein N7466_001647 [Penicillium verhagenii]|uniref:uncharacterized protein n=1 Tax=Penicillium verhagenii TaxID=1562060 RepID=UPI002544FD14|nr:uncharacterized protein N7466_001647 [Penicillium verhagenii]KAJ5938513.1 hypothetical protein N7466_001647 [Penicillium verhagenii]